MNPATDFSIRSLLGGYDNNFTYIITCSRTGAQVLVDAAIKLNRLAPFIYDHPVAILITHSHGDHITHLDHYLQSYPKMTVLGHPDTNKIAGSDPFKAIKHNQTFKIGQLSFMAFHTPGHYHDSICYQLDPVLFTGDTMFVGRTGRVISAKSDIEDLYHSVYQKILTMPKNTRIYPGHDYGDKGTITLEENVKISPLLQAKNFNDFKKRMEQYEKNRTPGS